MKLTDIVAISGQPGLFKFVARSTNGIIVESLLDGKRLNATGSSKVSALGEISVYTDAGDRPLAEILTAIRESSGGKPAADTKAAPEALRAAFAQAVPDYSQDMVHVSDMKKIFNWYNILTAAGMTDFSLEEAQEDVAEDQAHQKE